MRHILKAEVRKALGKGEDTILVASMGRSGSTLVYDSIVEGYANARHARLGQIGVRVVKSQAWDLRSDQLLPGVVYKTHDFPSYLQQASGIKAVFCFGSAIDAAVSVLSCLDRYGADWVERHLLHLRASGGLEDLFHRDALRFGEQLDEWFSETRFPVLRLKYDEIWQHEAEISDFLGFRIQLPERKERSSALSDIEKLGRLKSVFCDLDSKIHQLPGCSTNNKF